MRTHALTPHLLVCPILRWQYLGGSEEKIKGDIAASTDTEIASMKEEYNANKKRGVDMLVDIVKKVEYTIPKALKDMYNDK